MKVAKDCIVNPAEVAAVVFGTKESDEATEHMTLIILKSGQRLKVSEPEKLMDQTQIEAVLMPYFK